MSDTSHQHNTPTASRSSSLPNSKENHLTRHQHNRFELMFPLLWAPSLPLVRQAFRTRPKIRPYVYAACVVGAFLHGASMNIRLRLDGNREQKILNTGPPAFGLNAVPGS